MTCNKACTNKRNDKPCATATFYAECEGVMPMPTGCSLKAPPDPARQPLPVIEDEQPVGSPYLIYFIVACFSVVAAWIVAVYAPMIFRSL